MKNINKNDWQNPELIHENLQNAASYFIPYDTKQGALNGIKGYSKYYSLLNGNWKFSYFNNITELPENIEKSSYTYDQWDNIRVPLNWQLAGYDKPQYVNAVYPIPADPPFVPDENPVGVYKSCFKNPVRGQNKRTYICFEGINAFHYLFINNSYIGFSKGSHLPAKYDITDAVNDCDNIYVTVIVLKWADSTYLEDQDCYRLSGIFRDVYFEYREQVHINDVFIKTDLLNNYNKAEVNVSIKLNTKECKKINVEVLDCNNKVISTLIADAEAGIGNISTTLLSPDKWTAETPYLYTLMLNLGNEYIPIKFGVRNIEISSKSELLINGVPVKLKGVNRHDTNPDTGHYVSIKMMEKDLLQMKRHNINTIRTSHYPNTSEFLGLCDIYGFYVIDESDLECHGSGVDCMMDRTMFSSDEKWTSAFLDRIQRTVKRDKNHPCVIMWSIGNESFMGKNHLEMANWVKSYDDTRFVHYEGAHWGELVDEKDNPVFDIVSRMYTSPEDCKKILESDETRPLFLCEYCHAMGAGPGNFNDYWELIDNYPQFIGGCVWEWADHSIRVTDNNKDFFVYGGYFGEFPNDGNFCCDGLNNPDRCAHTGLLEYKYIIQPVFVKPEDISNGKFIIFNKYNFLSLSDLYFTYKITCNGQTVLQDLIEKIDILPGECKEVNIKYPDMSSFNGECYIEFSFKQKKDTPWEKAGYEVAFNQYRLPQQSKYIIKEPNETFVQIDDKEYETLIIGKDFEYIFSKYLGNLKVMKFRNSDIFTKAPAFTCWRAPIDNDRKLIDSWKDQRLDSAVQKVYDCTIIEKTDKKIVFSVSSALCGKSVKPIINFNYYITVFSDGEVSYKISAQVRDDLETLPRFGMIIPIVKEYENIEYLGYGDIESYIDMHHAARFGHYKSTISNQYTEYINPQHNGNHYGTKWACVYDIWSQGLIVKTKKNFEFSALHFSQKMLEDSKYTSELLREDVTYLSIDYKQSGVGSASCGPKLNEKCSFNEKSFEFSFSIKPVMLENCDLIYETTTFKEI